MKDEGGIGGVWSGLVRSDSRVGDERQGQLFSLNNSPVCHSPTTSFSQFLGLNKSADKMSIMSVLLID